MSGFEDMRGTESRAAYCDDNARWRAVLDRDRAADGVFVYAVRSTGIYCRPTCPARRPNVSNVVFFTNGAQAVQGGFRACLRCRPEDVTAQQAAVAEAVRIIEAADQPPKLRELARAVAFSPFHLQRIFKAALGLSPRQYAAARRAGRLKAQLQNGTSVTTATYEAGFGSSRSAYEIAASELGMTPNAYRTGGQGQAISYAITDCPIGLMLVAATERGVCAIQFGETGEDLLSSLRSEFPRASLMADPEAIAAHIDAVRDHLTRGVTTLDLPLDLRSTDFQRRVWAALSSIPYGETRTYSQIAAMIGEPGAARAVGRACALNPVALAIPCHRVLGARGDLTGYRWSIDRKRAILELERETIGREGVAETTR